MTDEQFELASAYLDGAVTDDERARVDADPEMLALVRELRAIGTAVSDPDPASADTREAAIAAALAEFDTTLGGGTDPTEVMPATPMVIPPPPSLAGVDESSVDPADAVVVPMTPHRRFRLGHAISVAAAAVVVIGGGIALFRDDAEAPTNEAVEHQTIEGLSSEPDPPAAGPTTSGALTTVTAPAAAPLVTQAEAAEQPDPPAEQDAEERPEAATDQAVDPASDQAAGNAEADSAEAPEQATADAPAAPPPPSTTSFNAVPPAQAVPTATATTDAPGPLLTTVAPDDEGAAAAEAGTAMVAPASVGTSGTLSEGRTGSEADVESTAAATSEPARPPELTTREEFAEFATALGEPPITTNEAAPASSMAQYSPATTPELLTLEEATAHCDAPGTEPLTPDASYVTEDGIAHPIVVVRLGDPLSPEYGGVDIETCTLVVATVDPPLVTTTTTSTTSTTPGSPATAG